MMVKLGHVVVMLLLWDESFAKGKKPRNETSNRVIGGYWANINTYPFMVSIQSFYSSWVHNCGGSIVTEWVVLTACHCLVSSYIPRPVYKRPQYHRVVAGVGDLRYADQGQAIRAFRFEVHPQCGGPAILNDAGIIILERPFRWTHTVRPISFKTTNRAQAKRDLWNMETARTECYSPGWGTTSSNGYSPSWVLKVTPATLMTSSECANTFCQYNGRNCGTDFYRANQVCASSSGGIVCNGDSGGPLLCNGYVVGVVSWKWQCIIGWPHVYSDLAPILDVVNTYLY